MAPGLLRAVGGLRGLRHSRARARRRLRQRRRQIRLHDGPRPEERMICVGLIEFLQTGPKRPAKISPRRPRCRSHWAPGRQRRRDPPTVSSSPPERSVPARLSRGVSARLSTDGARGRPHRPRSRYTPGVHFFGCLARRGQPAAGARHWSSYRNWLWSAVDACQSPPRRGGPDNARGSSTVLKRLLQDGALPVKAQSTRRIGRCSGPRSLGMPGRLQTTPSAKEK